MKAFAAVVLTSLILQGCSQPPDCCSTDQAAGPVSDLSLYQLEHEFVDQTGAARQLVEFRGAPVLIAMIFTNCSYACPVIIADIKRAIASPRIPDDLQVVLVSMDPERDHPAVLAAFAKDHGLPASRYTLLRGDADAVAELAAVLGVRYARVEGGQFSHSNLITLLGRGGEVHFRLEGLSADPAPLLEACATIPSR